VILIEVIVIGRRGRALFKARQRCDRPCDGARRERATHMTRGNDRVARRFQANR